MLLTRKSASAPSAQGRLARGLAGVLAKTIDRRTFLQRSGVAAGAGAFASQLPFNMIGKAEAAGETREEGSKVEVKRTVCTHCSVGCAIDAVVQNGVWVRQEPVFDSPLSLGGHCAKGASVREHGMTENSHRLKYPMKLENGKYKRISWDQAINEVGDKLLAIRKESAARTRPYWVGSSKHNNEQSYLMCKFVRLFGTNNTDHQARICHSTTVAGVANTWGYGAMTNSYNDMQNAKAIWFIGSQRGRGAPGVDAAYAACEGSGRKIIVVDPRFTRTAAKADIMCASAPAPTFRSSTGALPRVQERLGRQAVHPRPRLRHGQGQGRGDEMDARQGAGGQRRVRRRTATRSPKPWPRTGPPASSGAWARPSTPSAMRWCARSAFSSLPWAISAVSGGGANIFRGHDNVQGATDIGPNPDSLPGYYGIIPGAWAHWARVWNVDLDVAEEAIRVARR